MMLSVGERISTIDEDDLLLRLFKALVKLEET